MLSTQSEMLHHFYLHFVNLNYWIEDYNTAIAAVQAVISIHTGCNAIIPDRF